MRWWGIILVVTGALVLPPALLADSGPPVPVPALLAPTAERHYNEGLEHQKRKDFRGAVRAFEEAIRLREAFPEAWNGLGYALRQQGKYHDALRAYERALTLRPTYAEALEYMGEALVRMGRLDDARAALKRLETMDPIEAGKLRALIDRGRW